MRYLPGGPVHESRLTVGRNALNVVILVRIQALVPTPLWPNRQRQQLQTLYGAGSNPARGTSAERRMSSYHHPTDYALVAQSAEATALNTVQCWFESSQGYQCNVLSQYRRTHIAQYGRATDRNSVGSGFNSRCVTKQPPTQLVCCISWVSLGAREPHWSVKPASSD